MYADEYQKAIKYLRDSKVNINNIFIWTDDFNI